MSEIEVLHHALLRRRHGLFTAVVSAPPVASQPSQPAAPVVSEDPEDAEDDSAEAEHSAGDDGLRVSLTPESRDNIQRAPAGTRFFCVADTEGTTHCAASRPRTVLSDAQKSSLGGARIEPIAPGFAGTGHQQVARAVGIGFDETTARVGYVDGEGYGLSIEKLSDCQRSYSFRSAFNRSCNPDGGRELPTDYAERFERGIEQAFPACAVGADEPITPA